MKMLGLAAFTSLTFACAPASEQPTSTINPTIAAPDTCDEAQFAATFDFAPVTHHGDSAYCDSSADEWNDTERPRTERFWRNIDGTWSSEYVDAPQAGSTSYTLDPAACALTSSWSDKVSDRDPQGVLVSIPSWSARKVTLTHDGVAVELTQGLAAASNIPGLPCRITSTTEGLRR